MKPEFSDIVAALLWYAILAGCVWWLLWSWGAFYWFPWQWWPL